MESLTQTVKLGIVISNLIAPIIVIVYIPVLKVHILLVEL